MAYQVQKRLLCVIIIIIINQQTNFSLPLCQQSSKAAQFIPLSAVIIPHQRRL